MENQDLFEGLSKKQRKKLKRELEKGKIERNIKTGNTKKYILIGSAVALLFLFIFWIFKSSTAPKPGQLVADLGREHVKPPKKVDYNSNPPTSGPHYEEWEKAGIYDIPLVDEKLVHSLEHGYIIISYHCDPKPNNSSFNFLALRAFAHLEESSSSATISGNLDQTKEATETAIWNQDQVCKKLIDLLTNLANTQRLWKLIVVPRVDLDAKIALTAWTRIDKLREFDEKRIVDFINAHRNRGPEQTME